MAASLRHCRISKKYLIYSASPCNHLLNKIKLKHLHTQNLSSCHSKWLRVHNKHQLACKDFMKVVAVRYASSDAPLSPQVPEGYILDTPPVPLLDKAMEALSLPELTELGEPTLQSLGFASGSWFRLQSHYESLLQFIHVGLDVPWWVAIVIVSLSLRVLLFPVFIWQRKSLINHSNIFPERMKLKTRMEDAKLRGNYYEATLYEEDYNMHMKNNPYSSMGMFVGPGFQAVLFLTVFTSLRRMTEFPVESLKTGGSFWYTDLTASDPYYALPLLTCATLSLMMELGTESQKLSEKPFVMKCVMRAIPVVSFLFISQFSSAMAVHFLTNNLFSLAQSRFLLLKPVAEFLQLPEPKRFEASDKKEKFSDELKGRLKSFQHKRQLEDRKAVSEMTFKEAGEGAVPKTYSYNPRKKKINVM